ncbi:beta/gamma crystallin domain-containing protein, partial [Streptosporangium algeriense]
MTLSIRKALVACAVAAATMVPLAATPAYAINRVNDATCNARYGEFLSIWNGDLACFANGGSVSVAIYGVYQIGAGNNKVVIQYINDLGGGPS